MLKDKVGIVTGAGGGIGKAACLSWVKNGAKVLCADINFENAKEVSDELNEKYPDSTVPLKVDVSDKEDVKQAIKLCIECFGSIHLYFSNAGILPENSKIGKQDDDVFEKTLQVNTLGGYYAIKYASEAMKEVNGIGRKCSIVLTGSIAAIRADHTPLGYTASKGALLSMVGRANDELQIDGIRVNAVVPGGVNTDMFWNVANNLTKQGLIMKGYDFKRFPPLEPEEIANVVTFLASDLSNAIKGQIIVADGGMAQSMGSQPYPTARKKKSKL